MMWRWIWGKLGYAWEVVGGNYYILPPMDGRYSKKKSEHDLIIGFVNDGECVGIGAMDHRMVKISRHDFRILLRWYLWHWIFIDWFGLRTQLWWWILRKRIKRNENKYWNWRTVQRFRLRGKKRSA